jgi:hypothetical protein
MSIVLNGSTGITAPDVNTQTCEVTSINSGQLSGFRNKIINGDMSVSQVNGGTAVTPSATEYVTDQWKVSTSTASKLTFQQVVDAPAGFKYSTGISVASQYAPASSDYFILFQPIEGQNIVDLGFGSASPATVAVSLWVKGSVAGTYSCILENASQTRSYVGTISVTTSWAKQTVVLIADNTGTWATDNTIGLIFGIDLGSGSNYNTTVGSWQAGAFSRTSGSVTFVDQVAGSTLNITGVQLEQVSPGATNGTAFEHVDYGTQLARCQRYLPVWASTSVAIAGYGYSYDSTNTLISLTPPTTMRTALTGVTLSNVAHFLIYNGSNVSGAPTGGGLNQSTLNFVDLNLTTGAGSPTLTAGQGARLVFNNAAAMIYGTGAQL